MDKLILAKLPYIMGFYHILSFLYGARMNPLLDMERIHIIVLVAYLMQHSNTDPIPVVTAYYDAWMHDDEEEPILSLLYEIMKDNYNNYSANSKSWNEILTAVAEVVCEEILALWAMR